VWRWARSISIASRLAALVVAVTVVSLSVATIVGLSSGRDLTDDLVADQLNGLRTSAEFDIVAQFNNWTRMAETLAESPQAPVTVEAFADAFAEMNLPSEAVSRDRVTTLLEEYSERYIQPFAEVGVAVGAREIVPTTSRAAIELQFWYGVSDELLVNRSDLDDALDGSVWTDVHRTANPVYRRVVRQLELNDLLLIAPDGSVVYSVQKRPDLGTSFTVGSFSGSVIAKAFTDVRDDPGAGVVRTDLSLYAPAGLTPVGAIASPVMSGDDLAGVIVMIYDSEPFTSVLTADADWEGSGFPETGQTYAAGIDGTLRSEPRGFIESTTSYLDDSLVAGSITESEREVIVAAGTTVLAQRAVEETVNAGFADDSAVSRRPTMTGTAAVSTASVVPVEGVDWVVVTELDIEVAGGGLDEFTQLLVIGASIFVVLIAFAAVSWSTSIVGPIREMSERLGSGERRSDDLDLPENSPVEFRQLTAHFQAMMSSLSTHRSDLTRARERRITLLREMLPAGVAERVASGDLESLEEVPKATVVVAVITGLGSLVRAGDGTSNRELVDRLNSELDEIGLRHGLERIKIVGDAYFAACGHSRPYIDHAPRTVAFSADAQDVVRELGKQASVDLDVVAGVHTGPVMVGMTLQSKMMYDVWGPTVTTAHHLARSGHRGQILVSEATRSLLPDTIETNAAPDAESTWVVSTLTVGGRT